MKTEEVTSKTLEARMHITGRVNENIAKAQADSARAVAAEPLVSAVREHAAGTPAEQSEKGRVVRTVA
ncbi:MAG: hypothetical protein ACLGSA_08490 [Acidobacteriota bacterium]